jgi:tryptophan synthase alpha chain
MAENRIDSTFKRLKAAGRKGLIPFVAGGDPSLRATLELVQEFEARGADIIEIGVPFSDPLADGVVNQRAYQRALDAGATLPRILDLVATVRARSAIPLVLMSYANPIHRFGWERFFAAARQAGVDGLILSDCPPEEMAALGASCESAEVHPIFLVAPTSPERRIFMIAKQARGYVYYVSLRGVTGTRDRLPDDVAEGVRRVKALTSLPVAVGFGISTPAQAAAVAAYADAVIVGSAIEARIEASLHARDLAAQAGAFLGELRAALG